MRVVIFHYHLNPGGVTRIIEAQIEALRKLDSKLKIILLTGHIEEKDYYNKYNVEVICDKNINYLVDTNELDRKYTEIKQLFDLYVKSGDVLHMHNLNLGKNPLITLVAFEYLAKGVYVINHAHDFSEDRPKNQMFLSKIIEDHYEKNLKEVMYPENYNYSFMVLNSFDKDRLVKYGVENDRIVLLPNPVAFSEKNVDYSYNDWREEIFQKLRLDRSKKLISYPVRVIKRKNIGEYLLLAVLFSDQANFVVTQPPKNPIEIEEYLKWKDFTEKESVAFSWEAGTKVDFEKLIRISDFCFTTSIQEGFGMVFMEPWLLSTPVVGRNIPMVTEDMIRTGMEFSCLYDSFFVSGNKQMHDLSIIEQMNIIRNVKNDIYLKQSLLDANPIIKNALNIPNEGLVARNKEVILTHYSLNNYGKRLHETYKRIIG